jgi:glycosyltransferase involved in cell wall biosynthesis
MRILGVTPMLPNGTAVNAGPVVMYHSLAAIAARHDLTLATFAGPDPSEGDAVERLRELGIEAHVLWRRPPPRILRRWKLLAAFAPMPDPGEWSSAAESLSPSRDRHLLRASPIRRGRRRFQQARYWMRGTHPLRTLQFWEPEMQHLLDKLLAERRFDLLHIEHSVMGGYRYGTRLPRVLAEYEVQHHAAQLTPRHEASWRFRAIAKAEARRWESYQRGVWHGFDRIQVFTEHDAKAVRTLAPELAERVRVNPFGIELRQQADPAREESGTVVFVGGFNHLPNLDAALWLGREIMPALRLAYPRVRLIVVGSDPPSEVRALCCDDIVVTGRVPNVEAYLERASVVLAPMRMGGGMRLKVLQAMAFGKAVVTTPLGAEGLAVEDGEAPVVLGTDADELARRTADLLASSRKRRELGERARAFVARHHTWSEYAERLDAMYSGLMHDDAAVAGPRL